MNGERNIFEGNCFRRTDAYSNAAVALFLCSLYSRVARLQFREDIVMYQACQELNVPYVIPQ